MHTVKRTALGLLILLISTGIYVILVDSKGLKKTVLRPTLEALGNQLFAAVSEDDEKATLKNRYNEFIRRAEKQEIAPQQIEKVAADILNLTKEDSIISSHDAMRMIFLPSAASAGVIGDEPADFLPTRSVRDIPDLNAGVLTGKMAPFDPAQLAERLQHMQAFHDEYKKIAHRNRNNHAIRTQITFCADSGLRVLVSDDIKNLINNGQLHEMNKEFADLEKNRLLQFRRYDHPARFAYQFVQDSSLTFKMENLSHKLQKLQLQDSIVIHMSTK